MGGTNALLAALARLEDNSNKCLANVGPRSPKKRHQYSSKKPRAKWREANTVQNSGQQSDLEKLSALWQGS